ncbi:Fc.00g004950.m01.CDS01 [Cosmosporella sp. VM-42]
MPTEFPDRCAKCRQLTTEYVFRKREIKHYDSMNELETSAAAGCLMCRFLRRAIIHGGNHLPDLYSAKDISIYRTEHQPPVDGDCYIEVFLGEEAESQYRIYDAHRLDAEYTFEPVLRFDPQHREPDLERLARERIRPWVEACTSGAVVDGKRTHASCNILHGQTHSQPERQAPPLPTRVIDVGKSGDSIRLYEPEKTLREEMTVFSDYLILSYSWGEGNVTACTTKDNVEQRKTEIKTTDLPQTILDAIAITRVMGQSYLFVDAICIIQHKPGEDATDWTQEAPLMGQYYQNALLTIAAATSSDSRQGCLRERMAELYPVTPLSLGEWRDPASHKVHEIFLRPSAPLWFNDISCSPLYFRGWTLQERALSNRVLHFGREAVYWECAELRASEFLPKGMGKRISTNSAPNVTSEIHQQLDQLQKCSKEQALGHEWFRLATRYSGMGFTYNKDKLLAIHGIEERARLFFPDRYVAGCFESQMIPSLAWFSGGEEVDVKVRDMRIAPSWSWVSSIMEAHFITMPLGTETWDIQAEVISVEDFPNDPAKILASPGPKGTLELRGPFRSMDVIQTDQDVEQPTILYVSGSATDGGPMSGRILFDDPRHMSGDFEMNLNLVCVVTRLRWESEYIRGCMVLSPTSTSSQGANGVVYERTGWAELVENFEPDMKEWDKSSVLII